MSSDPLVNLLVILIFAGLCSMVTLTRVLIERWSVFAQLSRHELARPPRRVTPARYAHG